MRCRKAGGSWSKPEDVYLDEEYVRQNPYMKTGRYALLTVSDTGIGMDEKTRERVFEPFFTTKGPDKGTGLGLAMVYGIVKQHDGFIHLYSEPGKGTAFKVYFPAIEAQPDAVPTIRKEEIVRGGTETILLAEDEEAIRSFIERTLKGLGYNVLVARNGEEAIEIFRKNKEIVLAVLDVVMPRKGGKEAFEEMHKANPRLKVIFMSGYSADAIHDSFVLITRHAVFAEAVRPDDPGKEDKGGAGYAMIRGGTRNMNRDEKSAILVVDDDPSVLESTSRLLSAFGYLVFPYGNATDAVMKLQEENNIRVVLTDIMMPEVTGLQFLEKIRSFNSDIPVIMMTAYAEMDMTIDAIRKGAFDFLLKPFKPRISRPFGKKSDRSLQAQAA